MGVVRTITDLQVGDHLCCLYATEDEHRALLTPFLRRGLECGQKVLYVVDAHTAETVLHYLREDGLAVEPYLASGQLGVLTAAETYVRQGTFDPEAMIALLRAETERALAEGYAALRVTGEMTWVLRGTPGSPRLIEYEAKLNTFFPGSKCLAICQYDRRRFDPALLLDVLAAHPLAVVGTELCENQYYVPPDEMLGPNRPEAELHRRLQNLLERERMAESSERLIVQAAQDRHLAQELAETLETERDTLRTIMENTHTHLAYLDPQFNFVRANSAYARGSGYSEEELIGRNHFDLFPHAENQAIFERVREVGEPISFHARPFVYPERPELGITYWDWTLMPVKDGDGRLQGLVLSMQDVTERERAMRELQETLAESRQRHEEIAALLTGTRAVLEQREFPTAARTIFDSCKDLVGATAGYVALLTEDGSENEVLFLDAGGLACSVDPALPMPIRGLRERAYRTGRTVYENGFRESAWTQYLPEGHVALDNVLFAPLLIRGKTVGLIGLANKPGGFDEDDERMASALAELAAIALLNSRTLESLEDNEQRLRSVVQTASDAIISIDSDGRITFWNEAAAATFGYAADEAVGQKPTLIMPDRYCEAHERQLRHVVQTGESRIIGKTVEMVGRRRDGSEFPVELSLATWEAREESFFTAIIRDITERKLAEEELRQYAARLQIQHEIDRAILAAQSLEEIAGATLNRVGQLVPYQRASLAIADWEAEEALLLAAQSSVETAMGRGTRVPLGWAWFLDELAQGQVHVDEDLAALPPSSPLLGQLQDEGIRCYVSIPLTVNSQLIGSINLGFGRPEIPPPAQLNILEEIAPSLAVAIRQAQLYQQVEESLRRSQRDYEALVNSIDGIVWEADAQTLRFSFVSKQAERFLGYAVEQWLDDPTFWQDHLQPEDRQWAPASRRQAAAEKRDYQVEYRMLAADGRTVWLRDLVTTVVEAGRPVRLQGVMVDVSEQKAVQAALLQAEKLAAMGRLSASLAHEINNPLQSVIGCLGLAQEGVSEGKDIDRYLQVARREVQRLTRLTTQMRDLPRQDPGQKEETDLNALLERVMELCRKQLEETGIDVLWEPLEDLPHLLLVPDQINQVLLNLALNAIDAMPDGGQLQICTDLTSQPDGVRVEFSDSGVGIPPDVQSHLFEPFHSTKPKGSGLGLFTSYNIVVQHGGTIEAHSRPGEGTTFTVWLPRE